jgi:hypothetical protein
MQRATDAALAARQALAERRRAAEAAAAELEADLDRVDDPHGVERLRRRLEAQAALIAEIDRILQEGDDAAE